MLNPTQQPKRFIVQSKEQGDFHDLHEFASKRDARAYVRSLVTDWSEARRDFRIVKR